MTGVSNFSQPHHPARTFQGVELPQQLSRRLIVFSVVGDQLDNPLEAVTRFVEKEREQFRIPQIFVQFRRFTSTPRVPTISPVVF